MQSKRYVFSTVSVWSSKRDGSLASFVWIPSRVCRFLTTRVTCPTPKLKASKPIAPVLYPRTNLEEEHLAVYLTRYWTQPAWLLMKSLDVQVWSFLSIHQIKLAAHYPPRLLLYYCFERRSCWVLVLKGTLMAASPLTTTNCRCLVYWFVSLLGVM